MMMIFYMVARKDVRKNNHLCYKNRKNMNDVKYIRMGTGYMGIVKFSL